MKFSRPTSLAALVLTLCAGPQLSAAPSEPAVLAPGEYEVFPDRPRQTILGLGFEIQSDSIGSGNHGLPEAPIAVPHDLVPAERERLAKEMLSGFRYCRLAGGLYWRGLDETGKHLRPRWPEQLAELRTLLDTAGVEGLSFEYWSPAPYWKANRSYVALPEKNSRERNRLRPFAPGFAEDPDYRGDAERFFADFAQSVVGDIKTLAAAGLRTSMFGLQNEPNVNHSIYSTCEYPNSPSYVAAYTAVARAIRAHDPAIMLFADTGHHFPSYIGPAMKDPEVAKLVDAYAVHIVGSPSETPRKVHEEIRAKLPLRPWFQNEYEYLVGGATPDRCLNTVQHIMNSFQLAENPTWFWIHALKPIRNAEASGYSLGFWQSLIDPVTEVLNDRPRRWLSGPEFTNLPPALAGLEFVSAKRGDPKKPGLAYDFVTNQEVTVHLLVEARGQPKLDPSWVKTEQTLAWNGGTDVVYTRTFPAGKVTVPAHNGSDDKGFGAPHLAFLQVARPESLKVQIGMNLPILVHSDAAALDRRAAALAPGHWVYNPYNWHAVGSFAKRLPWNSQALSLNEGRYDANARLLAFKRPNGKVTIVLSNRSADTPRPFSIQTNLPEGTRWQGYRYTPDDAGPGTLGVACGTAEGTKLSPTLPARSWEFWEQL